MYNQSYEGKQHMKWRVLWLILLWSTHIYAQPIPVDQAFNFSAFVSSNILTASWQVAPGYHLYKQRINFSSPTLKLQSPVLPKGTIWQDPQSGKYSVLQGEASVQVPFSPAPDQETHIFAGYQGCADSGFCYPPMVKDIVVQLSPLGQQVVSITDADLATMPLQVDVSEQGKIANLFLEQQWGAILLLLFGLGVLLAFTPCVLPMVPILSSLIVGQKQLSTWKAFTLSLAYVLAMAVTYAIAGVIMGSVGGSV
ncbi:MAG: thiol:disulfide interchange protein, partial [Gammaproteobacteria bacterium]|nr:thiol:disulfide interchange protein [Gammaproteobacteria bacterium]